MHDDGQDRRLVQRDPEAARRLAARRHVRRRGLRARRAAQGLRVRRREMPRRRARAASARRSRPRSRPRASARSRSSTPTPRRPKASRRGSPTTIRDSPSEVASNDPAGYDLVVNATPLGMKRSDPLPFDVDAARRRTTFVGEVVMKQEITPLLQAARERGCRFAGRHRHAVRDDSRLPRILRLRHRRRPTSCARWRRSPTDEGRRAVRPRVAITKTGRMIARRQAHAEALR